MYIVIKEASSTESEVTTEIGDVDRTSFTFSSFSMYDILSKVTIRDSEVGKRLGEV